MRDPPFLAFSTVSDYHHAPDPDLDPDRLAKEDPLATQVWRMYANMKGTLPHAQRMEDITWRMMALALKNFTSHRVSGSSDLQHTPDQNIDSDQLAKEDTLATQVWRMYAKTKVTLPHAQWMQNITWRMMALALKKRKEDEEFKATEGLAKEEEAPLHNQALRCLREAPQVEHRPGNVGKPGERGRRIDKRKAKVRVKGFDGMNQDSLEEEYVPSLFV